MPLGVLVVGGERVPVGDEEEALVLVLEPDPVVERAEQLPRCSRPVGRIAADDHLPARHSALPSDPGRHVARQSGRRCTGRTSVDRIPVLNTTSRTDHQADALDAGEGAGAAAAGSSAARTRPPSSGGIGSRLKTASTQLITTDWATSAEQEDVGPRRAPRGTASQPSATALAVARIEVRAGPGQRDEYPCRAAAAGTSAESTGTGLRLAEEHRTRCRTRAR